MHDKESIIALCEAIRAEDIATVKLLIKRNIALNMNDTSAATVLHFAAKLGFIKIIELLITANIDLNLTDHSGQTALHIAAKWNQVYITKLLLNAHSNIDAINDKGQSALHVAVQKGHFKIVELLLAAHANVATFDSFANTPLHDAIRWRHSNIIKLLLRANATIETHDAFGKTSFHAAVESGSPDIVQILIKANANIEALDEKGQTALHGAARWGYVEIVKLLLKANAKVEAPDTFGNTVLHTAAEGGSVEVVKLLLSANANIKAINSERRTALYIAAEENRTEITHTLLEADPSHIDTQDIQGNTALYQACNMNHVVIAKILLDKGADIHISNLKGDTALSLAITECPTLVLYYLTRSQLSTTLDGARINHLLDNAIKEWNEEINRPIHIKVNEHTTVYDRLNLIAYLMSQSILKEDESPVRQTAFKYYSNHYKSYLKSKMMIFRSEKVLIPQFGHLLFGHSPLMDQHIKRFLNGPEQIVIAYCLHTDHSKIRSLVSNLEIFHIGTVFWKKHAKLSKQLPYDVIELIAKWIIPDETVLFKILPLYPLYDGHELKTAWFLLFRYFYGYSKEESNQIKALYAKVHTYCAQPTENIHTACNLPVTPSLRSL